MVNVYFTMYTSGNTGGLGSRGRAPPATSSSCALMLMWPWPSLLPPVLMAGAAEHKDSPIAARNSKGRAANMLGRLLAQCGSSAARRRNDQIEDVCVKVMGT